MKKKEYKKPELIKYEKIDSTIKYVHDVSEGNMATFYAGDCYYGKMAYGDPNLAIYCQDSTTFQ